MTTPSDLGILDLFGAEYCIDWPRLPRGGSFFLPTTATAGQVKTALRPFAERYEYEFETRARCEYGRYGVRVWRVY